MSFSEWEAATAASLDMWLWENNEYPKWFKAKVIAWHNMHNLVEMHKEDAVAREMARKSKGK